MGIFIFVLILVLGFWFFVWGRERACMAKRGRIRRAARMLPEVALARHPQLAQAAAHTRPKRHARHAPRAPDEDDGLAPLARLDVQPAAALDPYPGPWKRRR